VTGSPAWAKCCNRSDLRNTVRHTAQGRSVRTQAPGDQAPAAYGSCPQNPGVQEPWTVPVTTEYIRERFKKNVTLEAAKFDIKTENGVVELSGKTRFQAIVLEAAETALQVPGVKAVKTTAVQIEDAE